MVYYIGCSNGCMFCWGGFVRMGFGRWNYYILFDTSINGTSISTYYLYF